jgi:type III restriction enzyme
MQNNITLLAKLQTQVEKWRQNNYEAENYPVIRDILEHAKKQEFLRQPQFEAIETYFYLRIKLKNPTLLDLYKRLFEKPKELREAFNLQIDPLLLLELSENGEDLFEKIQTDIDFVKKNKLDGLYESINLDYPSYILALTMGAGKTILIASIIVCEFALSLEYPEGGFMKNALVFAPGKTILESLREISLLPINKIIPSRLAKLLQANLKLTYTRDGEKDLPVTKESSFNLIVTNTEKITLRKRNKNVNQDQLDFEAKEERNKLEANWRLQKIASLPSLGIFSDEAHHTYGQDLDKDLKRIRETINWIHQETNLICVVNTTGTPYVKGEILKDVIFWYGLDQGIKQNILKSLENEIQTFDMKEEDNGLVAGTIIKDFFGDYEKIKLPNGSRAKIAFYFKSEEHLLETKTHIEKALTEINLSTNLILKNTQQSSKDEITEFNNLNHPTNSKRVILMIDKGTEGWNCPSLFATALIREVSSTSNFILQASTRCLRQVKGNNHKARIYLSTKNQLVLDKALKENFHTSLHDLSRVEANMEEQVLTIKKSDMPKLVITKTRRKIVRKSVENISFDLKEAKEGEVHSIFLSKYNLDGTGLKATGEVEKIENNQEIDIFTATNLICRNYHLQSLKVKTALNKLYPNQSLPTNHLQDLFAQIEAQTTNYETILEKITEALVIIKTIDENNQPIFEKDEKGYFYHTIRYNKNLTKHLLHQEDPKLANPNNLGFHYTPYNFDSDPEQDFFEKVLPQLNLKKQEIQDIYFTGGLTNPNYSDFYFEWKDENGNYHNYFPDFLIVLKTLKFVIVEIKQVGKEKDPEVMAKAQAVRQIQNINPEKFRYEILYTESPVNTQKIQTVINHLENL